MPAVGSEAELVARARRGDQDAFRALVETHHQRVYRTAYAVAMDAGDASEITQETFIKAWRGLPRFRADASFTTWITRLALNAARDHLRRSRRNRVATMDWHTHDLTNAVEDREEVQQALQRLPEQARQVITLRYGLDLSIRDIALTLGCPEGTVKSRLHTALHLLRETLQAGRRRVAET